jgi:hypothetical protein
MYSYPPMKRLLVTVAAAALWAGCSNDLPAASFIDKLRVLAVRAQPPEVAPGNATTLTPLVAEPRVPQLDGGAPSPLTAVWLACPLPSGALTVEPCRDPGTTSIIGTEMTATYTPDANILGGAASTQILITVAVADTDAGAGACLSDIASNDGRPTNPDHCVVALKRLVVSNAVERNENPDLADLTITNPDGFVQTLDKDHTGIWVPAPGEDKAEWKLAANRSADAAQKKPDGTYEALTVSWFTTAGHLDGGRSLYLPDGCNEPSSCADKLPELGADTSWFAPTDAEAAPFVDATGAIDFWAVIRDDRGGVHWRKGTLIR